MMMTHDEFKARDHFTQQELLGFAYGTLVKDPPEHFKARLPTPPMLMLGRVVEISANKSRGRAVAETDVHLDDWFFQCHFNGDPVQPGCLGLDAVWQLLGFYCNWRGGVGSGRALGCGEVDFFAAASVDKTFEAFTLTGYYRLGVLGRGPGDTDLEHALAIAASAPIDERFGAFGELGGVFATEADTDPIFVTLGGTYTSSPEFVFDAGFVVGLSDDAPDFALLVGLTHNFGGLQRTDLPR